MFLAPLKEKVCVFKVSDVLSDPYGDVVMQLDAFLFSMFFLFCKYNALVSMVNWNLAIVT